MRIKVVAFGGKAKSAMRTGADGIYFRRRYIFKEEIMKLLRRILAVIIVVATALLISYLLYTGGCAGA